MRTITVSWNDFMSGRVEEKKINKKFLGSSAVMYAIMMPVKVFAAYTAAAGGGSFETILASALHISDYLCIGVLMFSGALWLFGNRAAAIERIIGGSSGYIIIRHARDIQEWLKTI